MQRLLQRIHRPLLAGAIALLAAAAIPAQADNTVSYDQLELRQWEPRVHGADELVEILTELYGRKLEIEGARFVSNLMVLSDTIVLYDTPERIRQMVAALEKLDYYPGMEDDLGTVIAATELVQLNSLNAQMITYRPRHTDIEELVETVRELLGRDVVIDGRELANISRLSDVVVVYDDSQHSTQILNTLRNLDQPAEAPSSEKLELLEYRPRSISIRSLQQALMPFQRNVFQSLSSGTAQGMNMSFLFDKGLVVVREVPDRLAEIREFLERLDQPSPQVNLTCWVIRVQEGGGEGVPEELAANLRKLLPYPGYAREAMGILRISAESGRTVTLDTEGLRKHLPPGQQRTPGAEGTAASYQLRFTVGSFDEENGVLGLDDCTFAATVPFAGHHNLFSTSTRVAQGEYAVLGVAGGDPLFVVLRVQPAD
ncbi:MAG TPA: hypothetical protein VGC54_13090 [Planctomycetota bacterium]